MIAGNRWISAFAGITKKLEHREIKKLGRIIDIEEHCE
jgi:hypothetical protein